MSRGRDVFEIIGDSPFKSLERHILVSYQCVSLLDVFFKEAVALNWQKAAVIEAQISSCESKADKLKQEMRLGLHKGLYLPVPRVEVLGLLKAQDKIPNLTEDVAGLVLGRKITIPEEIRPDLQDLIEQVTQTCEQAKEAVEELSQFFLSGFSMNVSDLLEKMLIKLAKMEHVADTCEVKVRSSLLEVESGLNAVEVMFLYEIIGLIGSIADAAESVGDRLSLLLAQ